MRDLFDLDGSFNHNATEIDSSLTDPKADVLKIDRLEPDGTEITLEINPEKEVDVAEPKVTGDEDIDFELSPGGILDEETITRGMSNLGRSANGCHQVFLNISVPGFSLTDITLLSEYKHLQKVEIPYNDITDLSPLGKLKYLLFLDASHNKCEKLLDFDPPKNLLEVNMSWNNIQKMGDLSAHPFLKKLILDNNAITSIDGLQRCTRLKYFSLSHNHISIITGLDDLPIQHLDLSNNDIKLLENIESLTYLKEINLSRNCIRTLSGLSSNRMLETVDLEANEVIDVLEMFHIQHANNLRELNLLRNPIQELPDYRYAILFRLNKLTILDRHPVRVQEKVAAANKYNPPKQVLAQNDHIMHVVYSFLQPSKVRDSTLPNIGTPYPMLVLVGPQGSGKRELCRNLVEEFGDYFGHGISHTTRQPLLEEVADRDYHFVSHDKFEADIKRGAFIQTCQYSRYWYGLQMESVENVAREGLACVVYMELEGVLSLKNTYFEPRYVLIMPLNSEIHERRLRGRSNYSESHINWILKRSDMYIKQNQNHPGFFDMMISSDDITEAYTQLRKLVMDYLGISSSLAISNMHPDMATEGHEPTESLPAFTGRALSNFMRSSTWSKPSHSENMSQHRSSLMGSVVQGQGIVEIESFKRRHGTAREVVTGHIPTLTEQLLKQYPRTAPHIVDSEADPEEGKGHRSHSAPTNQIKFETANDGTELSMSQNSSDDAHSDLLAWDFASVPELTRDKNGKANSNFSSMLPTETVDPLVLIDEHSYQLASQSRPPLTSHPEAEYAMVRPGSNRHTVLPPIHNCAT